MQQVNLHVNLASQATSAMLLVFLVVSPAQLAKYLSLWRVLQDVHLAAREVLLMLLLKLPAYVAPLVNSHQF